MKNQVLNGDLGNTFAECLLNYLEFTEMNVLPNYPFENSLDEEIYSAKEDIEKNKKLEEYSLYCLTHLDEIEKLN